jgi:DNA repair protein RadC
MDRIDRREAGERAYDGLRERAARFGLEALEDSEALALFLSRWMGRGARTWAEALLARCGSFERVLAADVEDLAQQIGRTAAVELKLLQDAARRLAAGALRNRELISSWDSLQRYLRVRLAEQGREEFRVLFLDKRNQLIADERLGAGTVDHAPVYPREVVRRALQLDSSALIFVHNHPSGDKHPSNADVVVTKELVAACNALKITVHDHLLVAGHEVVSFKSLGLI